MDVPKRGRGGGEVPFWTMSPTWWNLNIVFSRPGQSQGLLYKSISCDVRLCFCGFARVCLVQCWDFIMWGTLGSQKSVFILTLSKRELHLPPSLFWGHPSGPFCIGWFSIKKYRQKLSQKYLNIFQYVQFHPPPPTTTNIQKSVKIRENQTNSKNLDSGGTPSPFFWAMSKRKTLFMASLTHRLIVNQRLMTYKYPLQMGFLPKRQSSRARFFFSFSQ